MFLSMKAMKWAYPICPRITTIGKTGCDIIIDNPTVDQQHAVIEYDPSNGLVTLRDLSSRKGTFVNDQRVDGIVRLLVGDKLRFGCCSTIYEIISPGKNSYESFTGTQPADLGNQEQRSATFPPWMKVCDDSDSSQINISRIVPSDNKASNTCTQIEKNNFEAHLSSKQPESRSNTNEPKIYPLYYVKANTSDRCLTNLTPNVTTSDSIGNDSNSDQKDQFIKELQEQINRLTPLEAITTQKDILIKHLQNQLSQMNQLNRLFHYSGNYTPLHTPRNLSLINNYTQTDIEQNMNTSSSDLIPYPIQQQHQHQQQLQRQQEEEEQQQHHHHQRQEQQQQQQHGPIRIRPCSTPSQIKLSFNDTILNKHDCKIMNDNLTDGQLLERTRRERQILSGLVTQLQKDLSNKDIQMNRLNKELSQMKNQLIEKDTTIDGLHMKYNKSQDKKQYNLEKEQFEKEMDSIRQKYKTSELHNHSLQDELDKMKLDHHKLLQDVEKKLVEENKLRKELEEMQMKIIELERSVRIHQLDKHEAISEFERLRTRIMRIVFAVLSETQFNTKKLLESSSNNNKVINNSESNIQSIDKNHELSNVKSPSSSPSSPSPSSIDNQDSYQDINHNEQLLDRIQFLADDYKRLQSELQMNHSIDNQMKQQNKLIENELNEFIHVYIEAQQNMKDTPRFRSSLRLKQDIELLAAYVPASEILKRLQRILLDDLQDQVNTQQRLEDCVQEAVGTIQSQNTDMLHIINRPDDLINTIRHLAEFTTILIKQKTDLLKQIKVNEVEHQEELLKTKSFIQNEWKTIMDDKIAKLNYENSDKIQKAVEEVARVESLRQEQLLSVKATIIEELENKLRETRQILAEKQIAHETELNEIKETNELLPKLQKEIELKENQLEEMKLQLDQQNQDNIKLHEQIEKQCESHWKSELNSYKEQVRQHARTICVMEERLVKLTKQLKDNKSEVTKLKRTNTDLQSENKQLQTRLTDAHNRLQSLRIKTSARHNDDTNKQSSVYSSIDDNTNSKLVDNLKLEIIQLQNRIKDQTSIIEVLRSDLQGTQAQLSDIKGELPELQKEQIENALNDNKKINDELSNTKIQLANMKDSLEQMNEKLNNKEEHIKKLQITIQELTNSKHEYKYQIHQLQETINNEREKFTQSNKQYNTSTKFIQQLIDLGNTCKGERHYDIINKQKEALNQLRQQLHNDQYMYLLPKGNTENDELILQLSKLKRENAELRSKSLLNEIVPSIKALTNNTTLALSDIMNGNDNDNDVDQVTGQILPKMDHIGLRNAMDALYTSEECYLNLARSISSRLDLDRLPGQRSLIQVPKIERETVRKERQNTIELLSRRIEILKDQLQHKENLLNEYERDMSRLKQAEALADAKSEQLDQFINELRSKETEIQLLRQSLDRTREALLNEQRSVAAFKKSRNSTPTSNVSSIKVIPSQKKKPRQSCNEQTDKEQRQRKFIQEKLKRKDYEIDTLKNQLEERDKKLELLSNETVKMRMQMGLDDI
ncbi:unnamed protein product [Schistosoma spindalis]|nr:unnamed protein product [Schistosoma spindale]